MTQTPSIDKVKELFQDIIGLLIGDGSKEGACGINITDQFIPGSEEYFSIPRNINAAFLIVLAGENHPKFSDAKEHLEEMESAPLWTKLVCFYRDGIALLLNEFFDCYVNNSDCSKKVDRLREMIEKDGGGSLTGDKLQEELWGIFHPESSGILEDKESEIKRIREKRKVKITNLNHTPIDNVPKEILFTSNALLTVPPTGTRFEDLDISPNLRGALEEVSKEEQIFWYDHPVQIGVESAKNEILYGLRHLSEALIFEKAQKNVDHDAELSCVLSASVTHEGLQGIVKEYIEYELENAHDLPGLKVFLFTETETGRLIHEILVPAAKKYLNHVNNPAALLREVVGVDGRYGRHYSFLKAVAAFWNVFIDPDKKATFKIDLDQVFPQETLLKETGKTAFQHLMSPLWGADGVDVYGNPVHFGMIAGALVNERDIGLSIFTPDVICPTPPFKGEDTVFCSKIPQALSTISEMMTRYNDEELDGKNFCLSRVHVTGGTIGIKINALRKYRPFTPVFIGRAEDQAFLLPVLFPESGEPALRYLHKDGLFMRHDKHAFAGEAIKVAAMGKLVGDYERILFFSNFAKVLPWGVDKVKEVIEPFTGSFVNALPLNLVYLRLSLKAASLFAGKKEEDGYKGMELIESGAKRLRTAIEEVEGKEGRSLREKYEREKEAWNLFYDILDRVEDALKDGDPFAVELRERACRIAEDTRIAIGG